MISWGFVYCGCPARCWGRSCAHAHPDWGSRLPRVSQHCMPARPALGARRVQQIQVVFPHQHFINIKILRRSGGGVDHARREHHHTNEGDRHRPRRGRVVAPLPSYNKTRETHTYPRPPPKRVHSPPREPVPAAPIAAARCSAGRRAHPSLTPPALSPGHARTRSLAIAPRAGALRSRRRPPSPSRSCAQCRPPCARAT